MMDESQMESQSDSPQNPPTEPGQQPLEFEEDEPVVHEHGRKRRKKFWMLMALFNAAVIIGFVVMIMVRQSGNGESPDVSLPRNERPNEPSRIIGGSPTYQNKYPYFGTFSRLKPFFLWSNFSV